MNAVYSLRLALAPAPTFPTINLCNICTQDRSFIRNDEFVTIERTIPRNRLTRRTTSGILSLTVISSNIQTTIKRAAMDKQVTIYQGVQFTLDQALAAWLHDKAGRTGSAKTRKAYEDTINQFRAALQQVGLDLDGAPATIAMIAQGFASWSARPGAVVASATFNQRLAILSSFYEYAIKHDALAHNPIIKVDRRPIQNKEAAMPLQHENISQQLKEINRKTVEGARDFALLSILLTTGRRASELAGLRWGDIRIQGKQAYVTWTHCKGGKVMHDILPERVTGALLVYLQMAYQRELGTLALDAPIWLSFSRRNQGAAISIQTIAHICERYLGTSKVHATRHTFAVNMERAGAKLSDIGDRLGHNSLKTTSDYMKRLHSAENAYASTLEAMFGIE